MLKNERNRQGGSSGFKRSVSDVTGRFQRQQKQQQEQQQHQKPYELLRRQSSIGNHSRVGDKSTDGARKRSFLISNSYDRWKEPKPFFTFSRRNNNNKDKNNNKTDIFRLKRRRPEDNNNTSSSNDAISFPNLLISPYPFDWMEKLCSTDTTIPATDTEETDDDDISYRSTDDNKNNHGSHCHGNDDDHDDDNDDHKEEALRIFTELVNYSMELTNHSVQLVKRINQQFDQTFNNFEYMQKITDYYQSNPQLFQYTMDKELPRMSYQVVTEKSSSREKQGGEVILKATDEIRKQMERIQRYSSTKHKNDQATAIVEVREIIGGPNVTISFSFDDDEQNVNHVEVQEMAPQDDENIHNWKDTQEMSDQLHLLFRAANQSLFADILSVFISADGIVRPQHMTSIFVQHANFQINTVTNQIKCAATLQVSLPSASSCYYFEDGTEDEEAIQATNTIVTPDSKLNLATFQLNILYSPPPLVSKSSSSNDIDNEQDQHWQQQQDTSWKREGKFQCSITDLTPSPLVKTNSSQFFQCLQASANERCAITRQ